MSALPIIDFSLFLDPKSTIEQKLVVAKQIDTACREVGFFYLANHGVSLQLTEAMLQKARTFFETSTPEEKQKLAIRDAGDGSGDSARGYQFVDGGKKGTHEAVDIFRPVEYQGPPYEVGKGENHWPQHPADFQSTSEIYIEQICALGTAVVRAVALALDVDEKLFTSRINASFWNLRILAYEPSQEESRVSGIGEHTDFGILTFLLTDPQPDSLQVRAKDGSWISANPIPGCFLCNIGDMLSTWTNGLYKSTSHRVLHNSDKTRISIPLFFDPNMDALISPVISKDGLAMEDHEEGGVLYWERFIKAMQYSVVT